MVKIQARISYSLVFDVAFPVNLAITKHSSTWSQTCNCKKGRDWLKRWVEAQHNI